MAPVASIKPEEIQPVEEAEADAEDPAEEVDEPIAEEST